MKRLYEIYKLLHNTLGCRENFEDELINLFLMKQKNEFIKYGRLDEETFTIFDVLGIKTETIDNNILQVKSVLGDIDMDIKKNDVIISINNDYVFKNQKQIHTDYLKITYVRNFFSDNKLLLETMVKIPKFSAAPCVGNVKYICAENYDYIKFDDFRSETVDFVLEVLDRCKKNKIIFDLSENTGGRIENLNRILERYIPCNNVMYYLVKEGKHRGIYSKSTIDKFNVKDIIFLVSKVTMSSAELFILSIMEYYNVTIIGEKTYGKGVVNKAYNIMNEYYISIPIYKFVSPGGIDVHQKGIVPNVIMDEGNIREFSYDDKIDYLKKKGIFD